MSTVQIELALCFILVAGCGGATTPPTEDSGVDDASKSVDLRESAQDGGAPGDASDPHDASDPVDAKSSSAPPAAIKGGYTTLALDSTFTSTSNIDLNNTQAAGFDWYMTNPAWSSDVSPATRFTIVKNGGTPALHIDGTGDGYSLYGQLKNKTATVGHAFTGGAYYEARLAMELPVHVTGAAHTNGSAAPWPAFWAVPDLGSSLPPQWPGAATGYADSVEMDIMEFFPESISGAATPVASFTTHDWYGKYDVTCTGYCQPKKTNGDPYAFSNWTHESANLTLQTKSTDATPTFHTYGSLILPSVKDTKTGVYSAGSVTYYFDDVAQATETFVGPLPSTSATTNTFTPTPTTPWTYEPMELYPYSLILSAGGNAFMEVEYVRVWQK